MRTVAQIAFGGFLGIFLLLFFMANDDWVVIRLPSAPWRNVPSWPIYEVRLFGVMLISFGVGVLFAGLCTLLLGRRRQRAVVAKQDRINELEAELQKSNRLIAAASKQPGEQ